MIKINYLSKIAFFVLLTALFGCQNNSRSTSNDTNAAEQKPPKQVVAGKPLPAPEKTCYLLTEGTKNQDTTELQLTIEASGNKVTGAMRWQPYEKDGSTGTITAVKEGDIIKGIYNYTIEGSQQSEEVIFKLIPDGISQHIGELVEKSPGKLVLKNVNPANFALTLKKIDCK